jgi:hypothetical protein
MDFFGEADVPQWFLGRVLAGKECRRGWQHLWNVVDVRSRDADSSRISASMLAPGITSVEAHTHDRSFGSEHHLPSEALQPALPLKLPLAKLVGQKPPLKPQEIWTIRIHLELQGKTRDLALFNLAIDRKLLGCDLVRLKVSDIAHARAVQPRAADHPAEDHAAGAV